MPDRLDADAVRRWCGAGLEALRRHQAEIDKMNVYPVPDGDTGTNLVLTVTAARDALDGHRGPPVSDDPPDGSSALGRSLRRMARGALLGARGNSGVILAQVLRGVADALAGVPAAGGRQFSTALRDGADASYAAVADPVEGTMLTVARAAADASLATPGDDLAQVVRAAADAAAEALARTPDQLPALRRAGVVDAGGYGLALVLGALSEVVSGHAPVLVPAPARHPVAVPAREHDAGSGFYEYEVQYLLEARPSAVEQLRAVLGRLGDSLVVVGAGSPSPTPDSAPDAEQTWNVHVHVNDVGAAIEAGIRAGRPHRISVSRFPDPLTPHGTDGTQPPPGSRGCVVVCSGRGLADLFAAEGAVVVDGGPTRNPSTAEVLAAIRRTAAAHVVVLPNDRNVQAVSDAAARETHGTHVTTRVVHTRSPVQGLAALAVADRGRPFDDDVIAMAEAAGACRYAELTVATREALTLAGRCRAGDVLGLVEGEVVLIGSDLPESGRELLDRMLAGGGELVTLVTGADAPGGLGDTLVAHLRERWPFVEAQVYHGGQPHRPLLVGVE